MSILKISMYSLTVLAIINYNISAKAEDIAEEKTDIYIDYSKVENTKSFIDEKIDEKIKSTEAIIESLPKKIQKKIKQRKHIMVITDKKIKKMSPENQAEVQAKLEQWFKSLSLEKQVSIKIKIDGNIDLNTKVENKEQKDKSAFSIEKIINPE